VKRKIVLAALIFLLFFTAGCWNMVELNRRAIVPGFGVDKAEDGQIKTTVQIIRVGELKSGQGAGPSGPKGMSVYTVTGYTFFDTLRDLAMYVGRKLFLSKAEVIVVGEDLAKEGLDKVIDFYQRDHELGIRDSLLIAKGEAREVMETEYETEKIWA